MREELFILLVEAFFLDVLLWEYDATDLLVHVFFLPRDNYNQLNWVFYLTKTASANGARTAS